MYKSNDCDFCMNKVLDQEHLTVCDALKGAVNIGSDVKFHHIYVDVNQQEKITKMYMKPIEFREKPVEAYSRVNTNYNHNHGFGSPLALA